MTSKERRWWLGPERGHRKGEEAAGGDLFSDPGHTGLADGSATAAEAEKEDTRMVFTWSQEFFQSGFLPDSNCAQHSKNIHQMPVK